MTISYPLTPPSVPGFSQVTIRRRNAGDMTQSPYNFAQYVQTFPGQMWMADLSLPAMKKEKMAPWRAFFAKLGGVKGTFLLGDPVFTAPLGSAAVTPGTPVVDGAGQVGNALNVSGLPASVSGYLLEGDYIQLGSGAGSRLHTLLEDVDTDSGGNATLLLWPSLRESPADGGTITLTHCKGVFRLTSGDSEDTAVPSPRYMPSSFKAIEDLT